MERLEHIKQVDANHPHQNFFIFQLTSNIAPTLDVHLSCVIQPWISLYLLPHIHIFHKIITIKSEKWTDYIDGFLRSNQVWSTILLQYKYETMVMDQRHCSTQEQRQFEFNRDFSTESIPQFPWCYKVVRDSSSSYIVHARQEKNLTWYSICNLGLKKLLQ